MPSPFPGMDPFLENSGRWPDFHLRFINYWCEAIADQLPDEYEARIDERVQLEGPPESKPLLTIPDVVIVGDDSARPGRSLQAGIANLEPVAVPLPPLVLDDPVEQFIRILRLPERSLVTVLELLSPSNKQEPGRSDYFSKRNLYMRQGVNVVELDLLLHGQRLPMGGALPPGHFYAFVSRPGQKMHADVYAWTIRQPLPTLPIPLKAPDPEILLDLGKVFATTFERARYARSAPSMYGRPLKAPLSDEDIAWALERVDAFGSTRP